MTDVAVILLPGILGSPLVNKFDDGNHIWPVHKPIRLLSVLSADPLQKASWFVNNMMSMSSLTKALRPVAWKPGDMDFVSRIYSNFVLQNPGKRTCSNGKTISFKPHIYVLNYDWSASTLDNLADIAAATEQIRADAWARNKTKQFMYVTHSMGALPALANARALVNDADFLGVVAVAGPICGTPESLMRMLRGVANDWGDKTVAKLLADTGWQFAMLAPVLPGFADLLPFDSPRRLADEIKAIIKYHFNIARAVKNWYGVSYSWKLGYERQTELIAHMQKSIKAAGRLHRELRKTQTKLNKNHKLFAVGLTGLDTVQSMAPMDLSHVTTLRSSKQGALSIPATFPATAYTFNKQGDGAVPLASQIWGCPQHAIVDHGIEHGKAFDDSRTWPAIHDGMEWIFNNRQPASA